MATWQRFRSLGSVILAAAIGQNRTVAQYDLQQKRDFMKRFICISFGAAAGTLLYTRFLSGTHQFDWGRAVFVGLFVGLGCAVFAAVRPKKR
jgi:hypothetical protein